MSDLFEETLARHYWPEDEFKTRLDRVGPDQVDRALAQDHLDLDGFLTLLAPAAKDRLEAMARRGRDESLRHFGRVIQLFTPLYISDHCLNHCLYCGFSAKNHGPRRKLTLEQVRREGQAIAATGLRHILVLTGDSPKISTVEYIGQAVSVLAEYFASVGLEINAMTTEEYRQLVRAGADSLTIYQETYNRDLYSRLHPRGPKGDFDFRLNAPGRAAQAGFRAVNLGPLLGLDPCWQRDVFLTGLQADWLRRTWPQVEVGLSLPRMRPCQDDASGALFTPSPVKDIDFVQAILTLRLFLPASSMSISTRETAPMRDHLIPLGVNRLSAGVSTAVGGHVLAEPSDTPQFEISDPRSVDQMAAAIRQIGYQPVFKDWEAIPLV